MSDTTSRPPKKRLTTKAQALFPDHPFAQAFLAWLDRTNKTEGSIVEFIRTDEERYSPLYASYCEVVSQSWGK